MGRTHDVRNLAEGLLLQERGGLVLAAHDVHMYELERDLELVEDRRDAAGAARFGVAVEFENCHLESSLKGERGTNRGIWGCRISLYIEE
jgi:hypothetical protein